MNDRNRIWALRGLRTLCVVLSLAAWFGTQAMLGARKWQGQIWDAPLEWLAPVHQYLLDHVGARNGLLIASSAVIDVLAIFLLLRSIFGPTVRPFLGLLILFLMRQACQMMVMLPMPDGMIWPKEGPGFPSLLVTYGVGNDLFFSGHTALAVFGAIELSRLGRRWIALGVVIATFEVLTVLALRAHWTMDVYAGAVTAALVAFVANYATPPVDRALAKILKA